MAAHLEKVSEAKSVMDEEKGMTLAEISRTVEDINAAINERKTRLAPQLKKLRAVRATFSVSAPAPHNARHHPRQPQPCPGDGGPWRVFLWDGGSGLRRGRGARTAKLGVGWGVHAVVCDQGVRWRPGEPWCVHSHTVPHL